MLFPSFPCPQFLIRWDFKPKLLLLIINICYIIHLPMIFTIIIIKYCNYSFSHFMIFHHLFYTITSQSMNIWTHWSVIIYLEIKFSGHICGCDWFLVSIRFQILLLNLIFKSYSSKEYLFQPVLKEVII